MSGNSATSNWLEFTAKSSRWIYCQTLAMIIKIYIYHIISLLWLLFCCYYTIHQIFFVSIRLLSIRFCYRLVGMAIIWTKTIAERFGLRSESLPASNSQCFSWRPGRLWASDSSSCGPCSCAQFRHSTLRGWVRVSPYHVSWSSIQKWPLENNRPNCLRFEQKLSRPAAPDPPEIIWKSFGSRVFPSLMVIAREGTLHLTSSLET